jgi:ubiquinone/menaquinone biosynthesis C-methylase UbiE
MRFALFLINLAVFKDLYRKQVFRATVTQLRPNWSDRMVTLADIRPGQQVLEPSAGTGRIIDAIRRNAHGYAITAVELNCNLAHRLRTVDCVDDTWQADFLECNGDLVPRPRE